jgi:hypothetical protein
MARPARLAAFCGTSACPDRSVWLSATSRAHVLQDVVHERVLIDSKIGVTEADALLGALSGGKASLDTLSYAFAPPDGFALHIESYEVVDGSAVQVQGSFVTDDGEPMGVLRRRIERSDGRLVIHHELLVLADAFQDAGIAGPMVDQSIEMYGDMGIEEVRLEAHWVGRYVWARKGFEPAPESRLGLRRGLARYLGRQEFPVQVIRAALDLFDESPLSDVALWDNGELYPNEYEGRKMGDPAVFPLGKAFLLSPEAPAWVGTRMVSSTRSPP